MRIRRSAREWLVDAAFTAGAAAIGALFIVAVLTSEPADAPGYLGWELSFGGVACAGMLLYRRRWPVALTLVLIPIGLGSAAALGPTAVAMFNVAMHRTWRVLAIVAGMHTVTIFFGFRLGAESSRDFWEGVTVVILLHATLIASGMLVRSQRLLVRSLQDRARQAEEGQRLRVEEARHLERERLAREMHDVLAHRISLLAVHAGALEFRPDATAEETRAAGVIRQCAHEAMEDLREVVGMLRSAPGPADPERPQPTLTDLPALIEQSRRAGAHVTLENRTGDLPAVPATIGRHVYRIVQEALTNARKHAPGAHVRVTVDGIPSTELTVEVHNGLLPAVAATHMPGAGAGLIGLRERVDLIGGRLEHGRTSDGDFRLRAWLPWLR